jgi:hypothetical protein
VGPVDPEAAVEEGELEVAVLAPGGGVTLVELADGLQGPAPDEAVRRDELGPFEAGGVALVVRRPLRERDDDAARGRLRASLDHGAPRPASAGRGCSRRP